MSSLFNNIFKRHFVKIVITKLSPPFFCHLHSYSDLASFIRRSAVKIEQDIHLNRTNGKVTTVNDSSHFNVTKKIIITLRVSQVTGGLVDVFCLMPAPVSPVVPGRPGLLPTCL